MVADSSNGSSGIVGKLVDSLENRVVLLLVAVFLGIGANLTIVGSAPNVRADKWTATEDAEKVQAEREYMIEFVTGDQHAINDRTDLLLRPHVEHLVKAQKGWDLIYKMHEDIQVLKVEIRQMRREIEAHDKVSK